MNHNNKIILIYMSSNMTESVENVSDNEMIVDNEGKNNIYESNHSSEDVQVVQKKKEKKELAEKIKKENGSFMKSIEQTKIDRLKFLLKQTEIFAHFLVGSGSAKNKGAVEEKS